MTLLIPFVLTLSLLPTATTVEVKTLDGKKVQGELTQLNDEGLTLAISAEASSVKTSAKILAEDLAEVQFKPITPTELKEAKFQLRLADKSFVACQKFEYGSSKATFTSRSGASFTSGSSSLRSLLFKEQDSTFALQWEALHEEKILGDAIVLRRGDELTYQEVIIESISEQGVAIALDDLKTTVPFAKLEGLLFYQRESRSFPTAICSLKLVDDSLLKLKEVELVSTETVSLSLTNGISADIPLQQLQSFDYSSGKIIYLSDLSIDQEAWEPVIPSELSKETLALLYAPRFDKDFRNKVIELRVDDQLVKYTKGLALHAPTQLTYLLPEEVKQLKLTAGLAPHAANQGNLRLQIIADREVIADHIFSNTNPFTEIEADVSSARRLKILVEPAQFGDFSDQLHLGQARLLK